MTELTINTIVKIRVDGLYCDLTCGHFLGRKNYMGVCCLFGEDLRVDYTRNITLRCSECLTAKIIEEE